MHLIARLVELLERALAGDTGRKGSRKSFYSFLETALPKSAVHNLMQWNKKSLEEVELAFKAKELRHHPRSAYDTLLAMQRAESQIEFIDPYHAVITAPDFDQVYLVSTA